jgi:hypothetical protein
MRRAQLSCAARAVAQGKAWDSISNDYWMPAALTAARFLFLRHTAFNTLARCLELIQSAIVLSINAHPEIRSVFANHRMIEVSTIYSRSGGATPGTVQFIISNRDIANLRAAGQ